MCSLIIMERKIYTEAERNELDKELKIDEYKGNLKSYQIRAIRKWRKKESENNPARMRDWSKKYYDNNREKIKIRHGTHLAKKRMQEGKKVSQKTIDKYGLHDFAQEILNNS